MRSSASLVAFVVLTSCRSPDGASALRDDEVQPPPQVVDLSPKEIYEQSQKLFTDTFHELHVHMRGDTFNKVVTHKDQGGDACKDDARYGHVEKLVFINKDNGEKIELRDVGIRVRGNTSCGNFKKNFRLKFTETKDIFRKNGDEVALSDADKDRIKNNNIYGLKTFSIRTSPNDPTSLRDKLASEVFAYGEELARQKNTPGAAARGGAVYRVGNARVFFHMGNGQQEFGVYNLAEHTDKVLFRTRWGKDVNYSYQANLARAPLRDLPSNQNELFTNYEPGLVDGDDFEEDKAESRQKAEAKLREFVGQIAAANSKEALAAFVDVDNVLAYMVGVNLTGHWDSLLGNANNDHIIFNKKTGKWGVAVWDLDNSFGSLSTGNGPFNTVWNAGPWEFKQGNNDLTEGNRRPLFEKMKRYFGNEYRAKYEAFLSGVYDLHKFNDRIVKLRNRFTGGHSDDDMWETLFKFKNHRWAHARCSFDQGKRAKVTDGRPEFVSYDQKKPRCQ